MWQVCRHCGANSPQYTGGYEARRRFGVDEYEIECSECKMTWWTKWEQAKDLPLSKTARLPVPRLM